MTFFQILFIILVVGSIFFKFGMYIQFTRTDKFLKNVFYTLSKKTQVIIEDVMHKELDKVNK